MTKLSKAIYYIKWWTKHPVRTLRKIKWVLFHPINYRRFRRLRKGTNCDNC